MATRHERHDDHQHLLEFWFDPATRAKWFDPDPEFDAELRARFEKHHRKAVSGELDDWANTPRGCLALVILLDQVPRNIYRDDARAYASDAQALTLARRAIEQGLDRSLSQVERLFLYMPFEHSEDLADQERSVGLMATLDENPGWLDYARKHRDVIARFGRFPHRNAVLGRASRPEEERFLAEGGRGW